MTISEELQRKVDWQHGLVSPAIHFDEEIYRQEREKLFGRAWLVIGHEDMIPNPGDYVTHYMGEVPVIMVRDAKNQVRVLVNRCPHRGNQVCVYDRGRTKAFTCSYHGWSFSLDGSLLGAPMEKAVYGEAIDRATWGMERLEKVTVFHGLVFASLDKNAPSLETWLGEDTQWWLANYVLAAPVGGLQALPGFHRNRARGNWKIASENFIGDNYHFFASTHTAYMATTQECREKEMDVSILHPDVTKSQAPLHELSAGGGTRAPLGMGLMSINDPSVYEADLEFARGIGPEVVDWVKYRHDRYSELLKDRPLKPYGFMNGALFPNLGLMGYYSPATGRHFISFHPRGPLEHEAWQWTLVEKDAPQVLKDIAAVRVYQGQHMAGLIAPDDFENFERMVEGSQSSRTWDRPYYYGLQLKDEGNDKSGLPGTLAPNPNELNQRRFYGFWLHMMEGR